MDINDTNNNSNINNGHNNNNTSHIKHIIKIKHCFITSCITISSLRLELLRLLPHRPADPHHAHAPAVPDHAGALALYVYKQI